ncbi:HesB/IscA family protein [Buchnera aphidicola]|uniref:HesB/IscA family protein n=1 Tax=Buchnera aphidicola TaxID=9 RepID=UPI0031B82A88
MTIQQHNTHINKSETTKIIFTPNASKQCLFLIYNSGNKGIRLSIKKSGCAGFRYVMELTKEKKNGEIELLNDNIKIFIKKETFLKINGLKIDFIQNGLNKIFKFYNTKKTEYCGCGESFVI